MDPSDTPLARSTREFAERTVAEYATTMDSDDEFPDELMPHLAAMGFYDILDGSDDMYRDLATIQRELARELPAIAMHLQLQNIVRRKLDEYARTDEHRNRLEALRRGEAMAIWAFTEPGTGTNPQEFQTRAERTESGWVLNGHKRWITNAPMAEFGLVFALGPDDDVQLFFVDMDDPGVTVSNPMELVGVRGNEQSDVILKDVVVDEGDRHVADRGMAVLKETMLIGKLCLSAQCTGIMARCLDEAVSYAQERAPSGHPIMDYQAIHYLLAEMASRKYAAEATLFRAADEMDTGDHDTGRGAFQKLFITQEAVAIARYGLQVHGVYGLSKEYPIERFFRDAKTYELLEGSSEVQRELAMDAIR